MIREEVVEENKIWAADGAEKGDGRIVFENGGGRTGFKGVGGRISKESFRRGSCT